MARTVRGRYYPANEIQLPMSRTPLMLVILDGWGYRKETEGNAIALAETPVFDELWSRYPHSLLEASGHAVGLPEGQMGNSEVGHLNIGAGRVVWQSVTRIDRAIADGTFFQNRVLLDAVGHAKDNGTRLHLIGLVSDGGVHSVDRHYSALIELARREGIGKEQLALHAILDGRDKPPTTGIYFLEALQEKFEQEGIAFITNVIGRYFAMDRDKRWQRVAKAYDLYVLGRGEPVEDPIEAVRASYEKNVTDEFVEPILVCDENEQPLATLRDGDSVIFFNFRADRMRQIVMSLSDPDFKGFMRGPLPNLHIVTMTEYDERFKLPFAFQPQVMTNILGEVLSRQGLRQLRIAETEKYAHVTYFFNGGEETPFPLEQHMLVPSPKVATYDLKPEMSAPKVAEVVLEKVNADAADVVVVNFANADMVGHSGLLDKTIEACQAIDVCLGKIRKALEKKGGTLLITADHGNAEMKSTMGTREFTSHTLNPVPFILAGPGLEDVTLRERGALCDIAPTILQLLDIPQPEEMDGHSLLSERHSLVGSA